MGNQIKHQKAQLAESPTRNSTPSIFPGAQTGSTSATPTCCCRRSFRSEHKPPLHYFRQKTSSSDDTLEARRLKRKSSSIASSSMTVSPTADNRRSNSSRSDCSEGSTSLEEAARRITCSWCPSELVPEESQYGTTQRDRRHRGRRLPRVSVPLDHGRLQQQVRNSHTVHSRASPNTRRINRQIEALRSICSQALPVLRSLRCDVQHWMQTGRKRMSSCLSMSRRSTASIQWTKPARHEYNQPDQGQKTNTIEVKNERYQSEAIV